MKTSNSLLSCLFKVATAYQVILCNFRLLFYFIYIAVNSCYLNKPDEDCYWPVEILEPNSISRCLVSPCKSLLDCNVFIFFRLNETTLLSVCSTSILVRLLTVNMTNSLTPKNPKMCDPILVTLLKMRPHYSQSVVKMQPHPAAHPH